MLNKFKLTQLFQFDVYFSGYLKEKTCILVTHQLQYLTKVDQIILMEDVSSYIYITVLFN